MRVFLAAIIAGVRITNPIFANQADVVSTLIDEAPITKAILDTMAPVRDTLRAAIVALPEFERDRQAFAADLVATGHMDPARADTVSYYAVREAYLRGIPPAVVFGVYRQCTACTVRLLHHEVLRFELPDALHRIDMGR